MEQVLPPKTSDDAQVVTAGKGEHTNLYAYIYTDAYIHITLPPIHITQPI